jgi:hypothetical protein
VLLGPAEAREPGGREVLIPYKALLKSLLLAALATAALQRGELADQVVRQPLAYLGPELLYIDHGCSLTY